MKPLDFDDLISPIPTSSTKPRPKQPEKAVKSTATAENTAPQPAATSEALEIARLKAQVELQKLQMIEESGNSFVKKIIKFAIIVGIISTLLGVGSCVFWSNQVDSTMKSYNSAIDRAEKDQRDLMRQIDNIRW